MATINPSQDYDIIYTLTYASSGGSSPVRLYRGTGNGYSGTIYFRPSPYTPWTARPVGVTGATFPIMNTTMQIAHNWDKSDNRYVTLSFQGGTMTGIAISQKAVLSGVMGKYFMYNYANGCSSLTTLEVPDTSGLTSVGSDFMANYANGCSSLTTLEVPDTSGLTSVGGNFMANYANGCSSLTQLTLPKAGWFKANNVNWSVPSGRLGLLHGSTTNPTDQADWQALTVSGKTLHTNYIRSSSDVRLTYPSSPGAFFQFF